MATKELHINTELNRIPQSLNKSLNEVGNSTPSKVAICHSNCWRSFYPSSRTSAMN